MHSVIISVLFSPLDDNTFYKDCFKFIVNVLALKLGWFYAKQVRRVKRRRKQHQLEAWELAQKVHHHPVYRDSLACPQPSPRRLLVPALVRHLVVHGEVPLMLVRRREAHWRPPLSKQLEKPPRIRRKRYMTGFNTRRTMLNEQNQISKQVRVTSLVEKRTWSRHAWPWLPLRENVS